MTDLEKRLANTERALFAMWALMRDTMPPANEQDISAMIAEYFEANERLGADFNCIDGFHVRMDS